MKIVSSKKWEEMNQKFVDLQMDLDSAKNDNGTYFMQVEELRKQNKELKEKIEVLTDNANKFSETLSNKDKEVRKLKALLTKNKIDYKHLYKGKK